MMRRDAGRESTQSSPRFPLLLALGIVLASVALNLAPADAVMRLRSTVRDGLAPGQRVVQHCAAALQSALNARRPRENEQASEPVVECTEALVEENRRLELELAALRERVRLAEEFGRRPRASASKPLLIPELIEANWLGEELTTLVRSRGLLSVGTSRGLTESALVLQSELPLVDQGETAQLSHGDAVYAGRIVVGKIAEVGRHTSTVRRVTDSEFSGRARVARRTPEGLEVIAEGTLVGDGGDFCLLKHVTEPVAVGDEVFTGETDGVLRLPMYYGRVTKAELPPASREWSVVVTPAASAGRRERVQVLRLTLNRERMLGN